MLPQLLCRWWHQNFGYHHIWKFADCDILTSDGWTGQPIKCVFLFDRENILHRAFSFSTAFATAETWYLKDCMLKVELSYWSNFFAAFLVWIFLCLQKNGNYYVLLFDRYHHISQMRSGRHYWMLLPLRAWMFCVSWMKRQQQLWHMESTSKIFLLLKRNPGMWCLWIVVMHHFRFLLVLSTKANWRYSKFFFVILCVHKTTQCILSMVLPTEVLCVWFRVSPFFNHHNGKNWWFMH